MKLIGTYQRFNILHATEHNRHFYGDMGRFFCNKAIIKELEGPIYDDKEYQWVLAKEGNTVIAFASWHSERYPIIAFGVIWVDPQCRRQGIAKELFRLRTQLCITQGATVLRANANLTSRGMHEADAWTCTSQRGPRWAWFEKRIAQETTA